MKLLLLGGGHAHLTLLKKIDLLVARGIEVTVVQPSPYHYYSGMGPGMLGGTYHPEQLRFATRHQVKRNGGIFVPGRARLIDPEAKQVVLGDSESLLDYDLLSCNVGSSMVLDRLRCDPAKMFGIKPIEELRALKRRILRLCETGLVEIAVIGGGGSAVEIAANIHGLCRANKCVMPAITIFAGKQLLSDKGPRIRKLVRRALEAKGITVNERGYAKSLTDNMLFLENGERHRPHLIVNAMGIRPSRLFVRSGISTGQDGGLLVNDKLQSVQYDNIFGGGDCICFEPKPLDKVGVYAVRQNKVLCDNIFAWLEGRPLKPFKPGGRYMLIYNLGEGLGLFSKYGISFSGRLPLKLKDYIDLRFMKKFQ